MDIPIVILVVVLAAVIAAVSALVGVLNLRREQLNQKIAAAKWKREYFTDLLRWSDEAMLQLSEAMHLCDLTPRDTELSRFRDQRHTLRVKLSAQIDRGRWFFPNEAEAGYGGDKQEAFRGHRHQVINGLVLAYQGLGKLGDTGAADHCALREELDCAKRLFTSEIQKVLDPRTRDMEFRKLLSVALSR